MDVRAFSLVLIGVALLYIQFICGRICRLRTSWFLRILRDVAYNGPGLVATIAFFVMPQDQSAEVWILYLIVLNNSLAVYDGDNNLQLLFTLVNIALFISKVVMAVPPVGLSVVAHVVAQILACAMVCVTAYCKISIWKASPSKSSSEKIHEYMWMWLAEAAHQEPEAAHQGSNYVFDDLDHFRYKVHTESHLTVKDVCSSWPPPPLQVQQRRDETARRSDLCLSFALFRLQFRRYHGFLPYDLEKSDKTRALVFKGLMARRWAGEEHAWGFGVVEAALAFLHDHIHGGYVLWSRGQRLLYYGPAFVKAGLLYLASLIFYIFTHQQGQPDQLKLVMALVSVHLFLDVLQIIFYYGSDRWMVSFVCHAAAERTTPGFFRSSIAWMQKVYNNLFSCNLYWQDRIGQFSIMEAETTSSELIPTALLSLCGESSLLGHDAREAAPAELAPCIKNSIAQFLSAADTPPILDGVPSLLRSHVKIEEKLSNTIVKIILKWHIATWFCEKACQTPLPADASTVARRLSNYCAYLVAFRPELLPCHLGETKDTFRKVLAEVTSRLGHVRVDDRYTTLIKQEDKNHIKKTATFTDGLKLGRLLMDGSRIDQRKLWGILGNIWVKLILSVAPQKSNEGAVDIKRHTKYLAQGGEFVTHLWAIVSQGCIDEVSWHQGYLWDHNTQQFLDALKTYDYQEPAGLSVQPV